MAVTAKIGALLIKTLTKPVAKSLKTRASNHPTFRTVCVGVGRVVNSSTQRINVWVMGHKVKNVRQLSEEEAVIRGAEFLSEALIFGVGGGLIVAEFARKEWADEKKKEKAKEEERRQQEAMELRFTRLEAEVWRMSNMIQQREEQEVRRQRESWWGRLFSSGDPKEPCDVAASSGC